MTAEILSSDPATRPADAAAAAAALAPRSYSARPHRWLFYLLLADGLLTALDFAYNHISLVIISLVLSLTVAVMVIVSLVKQHETDLAKSVQRITWGAAAYSAVAFISGYGRFLYATIQNPDAVNNQWEILQLISDLVIPESRFWTTVSFTMMAAALALSISGLYLLGKRGLPDQAASAAPQPGPDRTPPDLNNS